jgi:hypothetical protein
MADALILTLEAARKLAPHKYRVLVTKVPPSPEQDGPAKAVAPIVSALGLPATADE